MDVVVAQFLKPHVLLPVDLLTAEMFVCSCHKGPFHRGLVGSGLAHEQYIMLVALLQRRPLAQGFADRPAESTEKDPVRDPLGTPPLAGVAAAGLAAAARLRRGSCLPYQKAHTRGQQ